MNVKKVFLLGYDLPDILYSSLLLSIFEENKEKSLSIIMSMVNKSIIKEKGAIENYMTGLIIKMQLFIVFNLVLLSWDNNIL